MKRHLLVIADMHSGHKLALMNPTVSLPDGEGGVWKPSPTPTQSKLWQWWTEALAWAKERTGEDDVSVLLNGDVTTGVKYGDGLVSSRAFDQVAIAAANLIPLLTWRNVSKLVLIQGTQAHDWCEGGASFLVTELLRSGFPALSLQVLRHALIDLDGVIIDAAHHGPTPGAKTWLTGNNLHSNVRSMMLDSLLRGERPPDAVLRAHYHTAVRETVRVGEYTTEAAISPGLCGLTYYAQQATRSAYLLSFGLVLVTVEDGRLASVDVWSRTEDLRTRVTL